MNPSSTETHRFELALDQALNIQTWDCVRIENAEYNAEWKAQITYHDRRT